MDNNLSRRAFLGLMGASFAALAMGQQCTHKRRSEQTS